MLASLIPSSGLRTLHAVEAWGRVRSPQWCEPRATRRPQARRQREFARASRVDPATEQPIEPLRGDHRWRAAVGARSRAVVGAGGPSSCRVRVAIDARLPVRRDTPPNASPRRARSRRRIDFVDAVTSATRRYSADVLLPVVRGVAAGDPAASKRRSIRASSHFRAASDSPRSATSRSCSPRRYSMGLRHHDSTCSGDRGDLDQLNGALRFPVVAKPARSVSGDAAGRFKAGSEYADDQAGLVALIDRVRSDGYPMLVQERIVGPGIGIFVLMWDGELRAAFSHRRIREKPPSGASASSPRASRSMPRSWTAPFSSFVTSTGAELPWSSTSSTREPGLPI